MELKTGPLTEDGILSQVEIAAVQVEFMVAPSCGRAGSVQKSRRGKPSIDINVKLVEDTISFRGSRVLEALYHAIAQRLQRVPRVRADGPRHLGVIRDDYRVRKKKKGQYRLSLAHRACLGGGGVIVVVFHLPCTLFLFSSSPVGKGV